MRCIAIIPARGGSKRIPRKNIKDFLGKPIIAYSIETALASGLFDEVMVSTDDEEIAQIACSYGAAVPFMRSEATSDDLAPLNAVITEVLAKYRNHGNDFDFFCCILPTAPLLSERSLHQAWKLMIQSGFDTVRPVVRFSYPIQRAQKMDEKGRVEMCYAEYMNTRTQDLEPAYYDAGQFYWGKAEKGLNAINRGAIEISETVSQDIDNETDWLLAEMKYKLFKQ